MKIRSGFVSNSSSSSFIVGFSRVPTFPEVLEKEMFGSSCEIDYCESRIKSIDVAKRIVSDIKIGVAKKITKKDALKIIMSGYFPGYPRTSYKERETDKIRAAYKLETGKDVYDDTADPIIKKFYNKVQRKEWADDIRELKIAAKAFIEGFWPSLIGKKVFTMEYDDSSDGAMEHGNIFSRLPHVRISKH